MSVTLTQESHGRSFEVMLDDTMVIRLPEHPTTGYQWAIDRIEEEIVALQNSEFSIRGGTGWGEHTFAPGDTATFRGDGSANA